MRLLLFCERPVACVHQTVDEVGPVVSGSSCVGPGPDLHEPLLHRRIGGGLTVLPWKAQCAELAQTIARLRFDGELAQEPDEFEQALGPADGEKGPLRNDLHQIVGIHALEGVAIELVLGGEGWTSSAFLAPSGVRRGRETLGFSGYSPSGVMITRLALGRWSCRCHATVRRSGERRVVVGPRTHSV